MQSAGPHRANVWDGTAGAAFQTEAPPALPLPAMLACLAPTC
jgi:hypothetical protein